jgi:hypothetical protein
MESYDVGEFVLTNRIPTCGRHSLEFLSSREVIARETMLVKVVYHGIRGEKHDLSRGFGSLD